MSTDPPAHDPPAVFDVLARREVDYVTVGGLAVGYWGHPRATKDTDIVVPDLDTANDERLAAALEDLAAAPLPLKAPNAAALGIAWNPGGDVQRYTTRGGVLDVLRSPDGAPPYEQLRLRALRAELFGARTVIVAREDLIAMKLAAARIQDLLDLDALLDPRNTEATRAQLRADDRELLTAREEPAELGEAVDPCEREVDQLRRSLAPISARGQLESELTRRARELRTVSDRRLDDLGELPLPDIPTTIEQTAARVAEAARTVEFAEDREFALLRDRERTPVWRRRDRSTVDARLAQATAHAEQLRDTAESGVDELRDRITQLDRWWQENGKTAVDAIAGRRERYRRDRQQLAEHVRGAAERPGPLVTELIGQRPDGAERERWDHAARAITAYTAQYPHGGDRVQVPDRPDRAQRGAWERLARAVQPLGIDQSRLTDRGRDTGPDLGR
jgi:uncharacterized protein YciW